MNEGFRELIKERKAILIDVIGTMINHQYNDSIKRQGVDLFLNYYKNNGVYVAVHSDIGNRDDIKGLLKRNGIVDFDSVHGKECVDIVNNKTTPIKNLQKISEEIGIGLNRCTLISDNDYVAFQNVKSSGLNYFRPIDFGVELAKRDIGCLTDNDLFDFRSLIPDEELNRIPKKNVIYLSTMDSLSRVGCACI